MAAVVANSPREVSLRLRYRARILESATRLTVLVKLACVWLNSIDLRTPLNARNTEAFNQIEEAVGSSVFDMENALLTCESKTPVGEGG